MHLLQLPSYWSPSEFSLTLVENVAEPYREEEMWMGHTAHDLPLARSTLVIQTPEESRKGLSASGGAPLPAQYLPGSPAQSG